MANKVYNIVERGLSEKRHKLANDEQGEKDLLDKIDLLESKSQAEMAQDTVSAVHAVLDTVTKWELPISAPVVLLSQTILGEDITLLPLMQLCKDPERGYLMYMRTAGGDRVTLFLDGNRVQTDYRPGDGRPEKQDVALQGEPAQVLTDIVCAAGVGFRDTTQTEVPWTDNRNAAYGTYSRCIFNAKDFERNVFDALTPFLDT